MTELKPCPFCGGEAYIHKYYKGVGQQVEVRCKKCLAHSNFVHVEAEYCANTKVSELWNRRINNDSDKI